MIGSIRLPLTNDGGVTCSDPVHRQHIPWFREDPTQDQSVDGPVFAQRVSERLIGRDVRSGRVETKQRCGLASGLKHYERRGCLGVTGNPFRQARHRGRLKEVEQGNICFVFPEGTRTSDGLLGEFKDGAAYLAVKSKKPLVPVYISGAYEVWPRSSKYPHPYKGFLKRKKIRIFVGKPLLGEDYGNDAHTLTEALSKWMNEMQDKYRNPDEAAKLTNT